MRTIVHCSDLHFGKTDLSVVNCLKTEIQRLRPDVLIVSGDLTQRARAHEFIQARSFLIQLGLPQVVIPGNHDVPLYNFISRFFTPFKHYQNWINKETHASYEDEELSVAAINTAHSWTIDAGRLQTAALERVGEQWSRLSRNKLRILVSHHPLNLESLKRKFSWGKASHIAGHKMWLCKPDLLCSGHLHGTSAYVQKGCVQIAAGTATSTRLRNEANSFNVITTKTAEVRVQSFAWTGEKFEAQSEKIFEKSIQGWFEKTEVASEAPVLFHPV